MTRPQRSGLLRPAIAALVASAICSYALWDRSVPLLAAVALVLMAALLAQEAMLLRVQPNYLSARGAVGVFGLVFFVAVPLVHFASDYYVEYFQSDIAWRYWMSIWVVLSFVGLLLYRGGLGVVGNTPVQRNLERSQALLRKVISLPFTRHALLTMAVVGVAVQIGIYLEFGGPIGYVYAVERRVEGALDGLGLALLFAESVPMLIALLLISRWIVAERLTLRRALLIGLPVLTIAIVWFGGLRSSRSNYMYQWALYISLLASLGIRITNRALAAILVVVVGFSALFGIYKTAGSDAANVILEAGGVAEALEETDRTAHRLLLSDVGRAGVQALVLERMECRPLCGPVYWGGTYVAALASPIPNHLVPVDIGTPKMVAGSDLLSVGSQRVGSSRVYGFAGEALMNFGILGFLGSFLFLGFAVGRMERSAASGAMAARLFGAFVPAVVLLSDMSNLVFIGTKLLLIPGLVIGSAWLYSRGRHA